MVSCGENEVVAKCKATSGKCKASKARGFQGCIMDVCSGVEEETPTEGKKIVAKCCEGSEGLYGGR